MSPPWMDKKLLEQWLKKRYGEVVVTECELQKAAGKGDNYLSNMHRLVVRTETGNSYSLVIKCLMEDGGKTASIMRESSIFRKENEMYSNTLPRMSDLLRKHMTGSFEPIAPECFYTSENFLVLEDLSPAGFEMLDRRKGLDLKHCLLVMRTLARFHAASAVLHQEDPESMTEYDESFFDDPSIYNTWSTYFIGIARTLSEELDTWGEEWTHFSGKVRNIAASLMELARRVNTREDSAFNVLIHGDLWTNNLMFHEETNALRILDFQVPHFASPAIDLHYFIVTSATHDVIVNHMENLLQEYHRTLTDTLIALGYKNAPLTLDDLHEEFDRKMFLGLYSLIVPCPVMQCEPDCGFSLDDVLATGSTPGPCMFGDNYKKIVRWLLPIYDRKGAFEYH